jgi:SSS family solute:Na+ symporter
MLDYLIIVGYFLLILGVGIRVSRNVKNFDDFSTGNRHYTAPIIFATLSASFIGGGFTNGLAEKVFTMGLVYVVALWGFSLKELLVATLIAPRMTPFKNAISVGDIMGQLYGRYAKIFTGFAATAVAAGIAGAQFAAFGYILNILLGINPVFGILIGTAIVVTYSTLGGLKSVVTNDVIHFVVLIISLPIVFILGLKQAGGLSHVLQSVPADHVSLFGSVSWLALIGLFLNFFFGETLVPPYVQRLLIGKNFKETAKGTLWSGLLSIPFFVLVGIIGLIALTLKPDLDPNLALPYVINTVMPLGLKGLAIAGMMAVVMSSADSFLNSAAISATHDVIKPLLAERHIILKNGTELKLSRIITLLTGILGAIFAISTKSALDILLLAYNFWTPFILVPLVAGIWGIKISERGFWVSVLAGVVGTAAWLIGVGESVLNAAIIGIALNFVTFVTFYFIEKRRGCINSLPIA